MLDIMFVTLYTLVMCDNCMTNKNTTKCIT